MKVVALDFETGGTDPLQHAPVSLGIALMEDESVTDTRYYIFGDQSKHEKTHLRRDYNVGALRVSGVTWKQIQEGEEPASILFGCRSWCLLHGVDETTPIVSHNAVFDQGVLSDLLFRCGEWDRNLNQFMPYQCPLSGPWICTQRLVSNKFPLQPLKLEDIARWLGLEQKSPHNALDDAILAGKINARLLNKKAVAA